MPEDNDSWPEELSDLHPRFPPTPKTNQQLLVGCFDRLCKKLRHQTPINIERTLGLFLTLAYGENEDRFNSRAFPFIELGPEAVGALLSALSWTGSLSLRCWCSALQILSLACNLPSAGGGKSSGQWQWAGYELYGNVACILGHPDLVQFFMRLLSGSGLVFSEKGLVSVCAVLVKLA